MNSRSAAQQAAPDRAAVPDLGALISDSLAATPDRCALRDGARDMSRRDLHAAADRLAARLAECGLANGEPVVLEIRHSTALVVGLCGVLIAGGAAVPVDPGLSADRRQAILADIAPRLVLTLAGDDIVIETRTQPARADPGLAFVVYTSGSSGGPKGVEISHDSYVRRLLHIVRANPAGPRDVDLIWTPSSFIGMLDEVFFPMLQGIPAAIASPRERTDPRAFADLVAREGITTFRITPSLLGVFLNPSTAARLAGIRAIFCSGETMPPEIQTKVHDLIPATLIGFYGATEAPGVAFHAYDRTAAPLATTICTPQDFATLRIMSAQGKDMAKGDIGEIWIGGFALARGYRGKPDLTAEKFVRQQGRTWYRTGDLGRQVDDGQIAVLGRADLREVNITGVRVSVPETCAALRALDGIRDAWLSVVENAGQGDPVLVGHCVTDTAADFDPAKIKAALSARLPSAAVPPILARHDSFPLTANGKLDVQRLRQDAADLVARRKAPAPHADHATAALASDEARVLLPIVIETAQETLRIDGLTGREDFFALGGNSLLAVEFALTLSEKIGAELNSTLVFNTHSLCDIAQTIADGRANAATPVRLLRAAHGTGQPLFTINSTGNYALLARHLAAPGAIYNLSIFGLTNEVVDQIDTMTLQDLAQRQAAQILQTDPIGPWQLLAFCQDGCLAIEIGRILQAHNGKACTLLLIDTFFADHKPSLAMWLMRAVDLGPSYYARKVALRLRRAPVKPIDGDIPVAQRAAMIGKSRNDGRLYRRFMEMFMTYKPPVYGGPVYLFVSREWRRVNLAGVRTMAGETLSVRDLPGRHDTVFDAASIDQLASVLDQALAEVAAHA